MKFCKKCHKIRVVKIVNPNNVNRHCVCEGDRMLLVETKGR